jgi:AcrR family transcriptional regulator
LRWPNGATRAETRAQLTDTALRLFAERSFDATTVENIVDEVEVSPRTFFRYFDSKEDVVIGFFDLFGERLREMLGARPAEEPPFTAVRNALGSLVDLYAEDRERVLAARQLAYETPAIRASPGQTRPVGERSDAGACRTARSRPGSRPRASPRRSGGPRGLLLRGRGWIASEGRADLHALLDSSLGMVGAGLDRLA